MEPFRYLYYQTYRLLAGIRINPNPKDNAIYFLLIFQILNGLSAYVYMRELFDIETLRKSVLEKVLVLIMAGVLWYIDVAFINFEDVQNKYRQTGFIGYLALFFYLSFSCVLFFYAK